MIVHSKESDKQVSLLDLLGGNTKSKNSQSGDIFSKLLQSLSGQSKGDNKSAATDSNGFKAVIDPKNAASKPSVSPSALTKELQTLLGSQEEDESAFISKELLGSLSDDQVRALIYRAKEHLKNQIAAKNPEYLSETKSFPKTLAGLVQLADKLGLEPQTITLSSLTEDLPEHDTISPQILSKPLLDAKTLAKLPAETSETDVFETITQLLSEHKAKESKNQAKKELSTIETDRADTETPDAQPLKNLLRNLDKKELSAETANRLETPKPAETKTAVKTDSLISLLQGDISSKEAKSEKSENAKMDLEGAKSSQILKADSFEVKTKEAQQSMRLFAADLKEAVENYKPPFTRVSMKLNPEKLGEVEVTLVQRGQNIHVNIQSANPTSVAFLAHNATELKAQLAHQGVTNATMNFMSGGEGQAQQQQQHQQNQNRFRTYQSFEELSMSEEQLSALEIIIPHYA